MTIQERKEREKKQFMDSVTEIAFNLIRQDGLEGLSLRKLAAGLHYSTTKLYQVFKNKQDLIVFLGEDICRRQNKQIQSIRSTGDAEKNLLKFVHDAVCFYTKEPWSAQVLAAIQYSHVDKEQLPAFKVASKNFSDCVEALNFPLLSTPESLEEGIQITRALMMGALGILRPDSTEEEKSLVIKIVDDGMRLIVAGWKSLSHSEGIHHEK